MPPRGCRPSRQGGRAPVRRPSVALFPAQDSDCSRDTSQSAAPTHNSSTHTRQPLAAKHLKTTSGPGLFIYPIPSVFVLLLCVFVFFIIQHLFSSYSPSCTHELHVWLTCMCLSTENTAARAEEVEKLTEMSTYFMTCENPKEHLTKAVRQLRESSDW